MDPVRLYSRRADSYTRFVNFFRYPQGIRAYFLRRKPGQIYFRDFSCGSELI